MPPPRTPSWSETSPRQRGSIRAPLKGSIGGSGYDHGPKCLQGKGDEGFKGLGILFGGVPYSSYSIKGLQGLGFRAYRVLGFWGLGCIGFEGLRFRRF